MKATKFAIVMTVVLATSQVFAASEMMRSLRKSQPITSVKVVDGSGNTAQSRENRTVTNSFEAQDAMAQEIAKVEAPKVQKKAPVVKKVVPAIDPTPKVSAAWNKALNIGTQYQFGYNSAKLSQSQKAKLSAIASTLKGNSSQSYAIVGFADPSGNAAYNQALSMKRAKTVKNYLVSKGLNPEALLVQGGGEKSDVSAADARVVEIQAL